MARLEDYKKRVRSFTLAFWVLFLSFTAYLLLTFFLVTQRQYNVWVTLIFEESSANNFGIILVFFYLTAGLYLTYFFYQRAYTAKAHKGQIYALASVVIGVSAPYTYALLLSFMGLMRNILPVLYVAPLYILGIGVGLRIIPSLIAHLKSP